MTQAAPGKHYREGIGIIELGDMFPTEKSAVKWFENLVWADGRYCPRCGCTNTKKAAKTSGLPYYCTGCQQAFSVKIGTALERSKIPLRKWDFAIYLEMTNLKGVSSMKLHRDIKVTQKSAWFMLHRIREACAGETKALTGRGPVGKTAVVGAKDRKTNQVAARAVQSTDAPTLQGFVEGVTSPDAKVYTDEARAYKRHGQGPRERQPQRQGISQGNGPHQRHGVVLGNAQERLSGRLPQDQPEASGPVRE